MMDDEKKYEYLEQAFLEKEFQELLKTEKEKIAEIIQKYLDELKEVEEKYRVLFSVESRVKTIKSFAEKVRRKNYIQIWEITDDMKLNQQYICNNLPDLIGIRVNCYFWENEEKIYEIFKRDASKFDRIVFNFDENKKQQNGHTIYKFTAKYDGRINFEIQIKSVMHNVWGEVEHQNVYKNRNYDGFVDSKKNISEVIYDILKASDKQLVSLYRVEETDEQLLRSLFFNKTKEKIASRCRTDILARHYIHYFTLFSDITDIKRFVICALSEATYDRSRITVTGSEEVRAVAEKIKTEISIFDLRCIYEIDLMLHEIDSFDDFLFYLIERTFISKYIEDEFDFEFKYSFDDSDEQEQVNDKYTDYINKMITVFGGARANE